MAMSNRSLKDLLEFLEYLGEKGLMPRSTAVGRKAACGKVLGVLDPEELSDVTNIDLGNAMERFINLEGRKYNPSSLGVYRSRVSSSIAEFSSYLENPAAFKINNGQKKPQVDGQRKNVANKSNKVGLTIQPAVQRSEMMSAPNANVFPIPIRADVVVRVHGLPFDLTIAEAEKIASVVKAMAMVP
jgi:hypothetical protein